MRLTPRTAPEVEAGVLATVAQAIRDRERIRFGYTVRGVRAPGEDLPRHVEPHQLVTVGRRWYLLGYDLDRKDWRSFRLDRLRGPAGTRAPLRPREVPGGDAAAYVRPGLSGGEQALRLVVTVHASRAHVERRIGPWATVVEDDGESCRLEIETAGPRWAAFGLVLLDAPVVLDDVPEPVLAAMTGWSRRLAEMLPDVLGEDHPVSGRRGGRTR